MNEDSLREIGQIIGYEFSDVELLKHTFVHSSDVENRLFSNERLEFLGDAILSVVICEALFERFPFYLEGDLTKIKSMLVSRRTCAKIVKQVELHKFLKVGKGMASSRALTGSIAAGLLEAIIAAVYLDGGLKAAKDFILKIFGSLIEEANAEHDQGNFKSLLQQHAQQSHNTIPVYELLDEKGPDHDKCFEIQVVLANQYFPSAWGTNKKEAEQKAALNALVKLGLIEASEAD